VSAPIVYRVIFQPSTPTDGTGPILVVRLRAVPHRPARTDRPVGTGVEDPAARAAS
jgi:hypothetical protein